MVRWLLIILASICVVYSLVWWTAAWFVRSNVVQRIDELERDKMSVSVQQHGATGWLNFGFYYQFKDLNVEIPASGIILKVPEKIQSGISFLSPFKISTELDAGTVIVSPFASARLGALTGIANVRPDPLAEAFDIQLTNAKIDMLTMIKLTGEDIHISYQSSHETEKTGSLRASARLIPSKSKTFLAETFLEQLDTGILLPHHAFDIELEATFYPSGPLIDNDIHFGKEWLDKEGHYIVVGTLNAPIHEALTEPSKALIFKSKTGGLNIILCPKQCTANSKLDCEPNAVIQNWTRRDESAIALMSLPGEFADKNGSQLCKAL